MGRRPGGRRRGDEGRLRFSVVVSLWVGPGCDAWEQKGSQVVILSSLRVLTRMARVRANSDCKIVWVILWKSRRGMFWMGHRSPVALTTDNRLSVNDRGVH